MKKIIFIILMSFSHISAQEKIYTQEELEIFIEQNPMIPREKIETFKAILMSNKELIGWTHYYKKKCYHSLQDKENDSVLFYGNKGLEALEHLKKTKPNSKEFIRAEKYTKGIYTYMGIVLSWQNKYRESVEYLFKAEELIEKYPNLHTTQNPFILGHIANNFIKMGDKREALKYRLKISRDSAYMKTLKGAAITYNRLGILYDAIGKKDSTIYYYRESLKNRIKINDFSGIRSMYGNIGDSYMDIGNIDSTLFYYKKAKEILDASPNENHGYSKYFTVANYSFVLYKQGNVNQAIGNLKIVMDSIKKIEIMDDDIKNLHTITIDYLILCYQNTNQLDKALEISEQKNKILEKYHQQVLDEKLNELSVVYDVKKKEKSILRLEKTTLIQEGKIEQRNIILFLLGASLLLLFGFGILYQRQRKLKNKYETANLEQRLLRSQLNPHFVFNALNTISSLAYKNSKNTSSYITKLSSLIRLVLKNSREEFVLLEDELKSLEDYLQLQSDFSQKFRFVIDVDDKIDRNEIYIPPMFIQPFIENSIAHGLQGIENGIINVIININKRDKLIFCKIIDNGIGISKTSTLKVNGSGSFSGKILNERLKIYAKSLNKKAKFTIQDSEFATGTEVKLYLPYVLDL